ncbi:unnamed protein product [Caenorhabditis sp. 36 PRJEB53466]|nr:unnamed protein product [Caenorhabditis sp. 36 PRJEB53466]
MGEGVARWQDGLNFHYAQVLEEFCGDLLRPREVLHLVLPRVTKEAVAVSEKLLLHIEDVGELEKVLKEAVENRRPQLLVLITPFSLDQSEVEGWARAIATVPAQIEVLVPAHNLEFDHTDTDAFCRLFRSLRRTNGEMWVIHPDTPVPSKRYQSLISTTHHLSTAEYWGLLKELADVADIPWPYCPPKTEPRKHAVEEAVRGHANTNTSKVANTKPTAVGQGGSGPARGGRVQGGRSVNGPYHKTQHHPACSRKYRQ